MSFLVKRIKDYSLPKYKPFNMYFYIKTESIQNKCSEFSLAVENVALEYLTDIF